MRRYDELVAVRKGLIDGMEGPEQFLWQGQLWQVRAVVARWVQTPPWWEHRAIRGLLGAATTPADAASSVDDLPDVLRWQLEDGLETAPYGRGFIEELDRRLLGHFGLTHLAGGDPGAAASGSEGAT